jgi:endogenous inhibitor of DNA gyrase (YacG/DUF329 family)
MRRAVVTASAFEVLCPECHTAVAEPESGSFLWAPCDLNQRVLTCPDCGTQMRLGAKMRERRANQ